MASVVAPLPAPWQFGYRKTVCDYGGLRSAGRDHHWSLSMPTYDYECDACGHKFEHYQGINDDVLKKCPECKKLKLRRLIGMGGECRSF